MNKIANILFKKLSEKANIPNYATAGSAGADLTACVDEIIEIQPNMWAKIPTGLSVQMPSNVVGLIFPRSGLAFRNGITLQNAVGVIDSDFRGEIEILIRNEDIETFKILHGDRIAQIVFMPFIQANIISVDELDVTNRGTGGFGSTGNN